MKGIFASEIRGSGPCQLNRQCIFWVLGGADDRRIDLGIRYRLFDVGNLRLEVS